MPFEVQKCCLDNGRCPFDDWFARLSPQFKSRVLQRIVRLEIGNFGDCRAIAGGNGVSELRLDFGPGFRVYYGIDGATIILLLCGGDKSSQRRDIGKAKGLWTAYKAKGNANENGIVP